MKFCITFVWENFKQSSIALILVQKRILWLIKNVFKILFFVWFSVNKHTKLSKLYLLSIVFLINANDSISDTLFIKKWYKNVIDRYKMTVCKWYSALNIKIGVLQSMFYMILQGTIFNMHGMYKSICLNLGVSIILNFFEKFTR